MQIRTIETNQLRRSFKGFQARSRLLNKLQLAAVPMYELSYGAPIKASKHIINDILKDLENKSGIVLR